MRHDHPRHATPVWQPQSPATLVVGAAAFLLLALFVILGFEASAGRTLPVDHAIMYTVHAWTTPTLTIVMIGATTLGTFYVIGPVCVIEVAIFYRLEERLTAGVLIVAIASDPVVIEGAKLVFARPRPELWPHLLPAFGYSYPSGHTALATVTYGLSAALIAPRLATILRRVAIVVVAVTLIVVVGLSRIYLGVHYPSDVLGGLLFGSAWILISLKVLGTAPADRCLTTTNVQRPP